MMMEEVENTAESTPSEASEAAPSEASEAAPSEASEANLSDAEDSDATALEARELAEQMRRERLREVRLEARIEALIFAAHKPLKNVDILQLLDDDEDLSIEDVDRTLEDLVQFYQLRAGGLTLRYIKRQGYQFQTVASTGPLMERMFASRPRPISRASMETLAIVAYRQPVTRAEVEFIRGVDVGSIVRGLLERGLIRCVGRKEVPGRPMLFGTTDEFLKTFNLGSVKDLPPLESFQPAPETLQKAKQAGDLDAGDDVDIEQYISDNVAAAEGLTSEDSKNIEENSETVAQPPQNELQNKLTPRRIEGATVVDRSPQQLDQQIDEEGAGRGDPNDANRFDPKGLDPDRLDPDRLDRASDDAADQADEMAISDGGQLEAPGRELD